MRIAGIVLLVIGLIGVVVFGIQAINESDSFNFLGLDIAVSKADWTPLIISAAVTVIGFFVMKADKN